MKLILKYSSKAIRLFPVQFAASMGLVLFMTVLNAAAPWGLKIYIEEVTRTNELGVFALGLVLFALYYALCIGIQIAWYVALDRFGGKYINHLTVELQGRMARTFYSEIEKVQPNIIRNILFTDVLNVFRVIGHHLPSLLNALAIILAALILAAIYDIKIALLIFLAVLIGLLLSWASRKILAKTAGATNAKLKVHDAWCTHFVQLLPLIHTHNILRYFQQHSTENIENFIETSVQEDKRTLFWSELINSYHGLFSIALSALLAMPLVQNSIADLVFYTMISSLVMNQAQSAELLFQQIIKSYVSFQHIDELNQLPARPGKKAIPDITSIAFENVDFVYSNGVHALKQVSCVLYRGDVVRLQGQNGSGKSTFIKLLTGLYAPSGGELQFNGINSLHFSQDSRNGAILYLGQDELCLNEDFATYLEVMSGKSLSQEQYMHLASFVDFLEDKRKITENGLSLSVGQRKKLLFMQLLLRCAEASVIIMDELTAGLDGETTRKFNQYLEDLAKQQDKILILVDHASGENLPVTRQLIFEDGCLQEE